MTTRLSLNGFVLLSVVAVLSTAPSCSTAEPGEGDSESNLRISLAPSVVTRVTGTSFDEDDAIGLSVVPWVNGTEQPLSASRWEDNVKFVYRDGQFVSTSTAYFPDATTPNTFYAYYPYDAAGFASGASTLKVRTASDQRDAKARMTSDWLVAVTRNVVPNGKAVPVVFRHVLSQMQIRMIAGEGVTNEELLYAGIVLKDFGTVADYDVDAESFGDVSEKTDILPSGSWAIDGGYVTGMSAIVVPQTRKAGESVIYFTYAGKTLAYKPSSDFTFESGRSHLFTATISMTSQGPTLSVSAQIDDWQEGGVITGDADQPQTPQAPVKDIDGNEYPVVKIGDLYWMAANLRTQHLTDGTEIPVAKGNEASWDGLTSPAACDFMDKTENRSTYGLLYNYYTVDTGKLCPEGWSVPDCDQMQSLLDAVPNAADLMAPDSRWSHYNPTNASGFGALPGGITSYYGWFTGDCGIWTSYKSENSPYYLYLTNSPYIDYYYMYSGMYVRCVKKAEPEPEPEPTTVKDIDGNEYPTVEIGNLTWMAANLRTQHLTDGTEIPIAKGNEASWDGLTSPAACDFMDKTENRSTYGLLYNYYTVDTGKLCPEGWAVPDCDQMQSLLDAVPNAADLMAPDSRWSHYNPTNASGFGALPGGITSYYGWFTGDCGIWTSYKSENSPYYLYLTNSPYIDYYYMYSGMYVRCVKVN